MHVYIFNIPKKNSLLNIATSMPLTFLDNFAEKKENSISAILTIPTIKKARPTT